MKNFRFLVIALVAILGFSSCEKHNDVDHSADLVGTWTCLQGGYAEALVISADGSALSTGYDGVEYWENLEGNIVVKDNNITMTFEDGDNFEGHFDIVPGVAFSIFTDEGAHLTFNYCENDLADEIIGMWVCNDFPTDEETDMMIETFYENGKSTLTGFLPMGDDSEQILNNETDYKVVGDLLFIEIPAEKIGAEKPIYVVDRLIYSPNGTGLGDVLTLTACTQVEDEYIEVTSTWLRVKESLNLTGITYDYSSAYVTNANGKDEDFNIFGHTFNIANIEGNDFDMLFRSELFCLDLNANTIKQYFRPNGENLEVEMPITVEGNKVVIDYNATTPALRKVDVYMFQDADDSQLHIYMPTSSFINYFANLEVVTMLQSGLLDPADAAAVEKVFNDMEARVESINVSLVMKARK